LRRIPGPTGADQRIERMFARVADGSRPAAVGTVPAAGAAVIRRRRLRVTANRTWPGPGTVPAG
jgi:hypothetical protein